MAQEQRFKVEFNSSTYRRNVYLSCSWRPDEGKSASWVIVRDLDSNDIRVLGDVRDQPEQDPERIRRIMGGCSGFVCVLPYRDNAHTTSPYILQELALAVEKDLPIVLFRDDRVQISTKKDSTHTEIDIQNSAAISFPVPSPFRIPNEKFFGLFEYTLGNEGKSVEEQLKFKVGAYVEALKNKPNVREPYALVFSRLQDDFAHARAAIRSTVQESAGIPCIWINDDFTRYTTNINGVRERTRELLRHAEFIIVDISRSADRPSAENPTLAFELGQADYSQKPFFVSLKRYSGFETYYAIEDMQLNIWDDEANLHQDLSSWLKSNEAHFSRYTYNRAPELQREGYTPKVVDFTSFTFNKAQSYKLEILSIQEKFFIALAIGVMIFTGSQLFESYTGFSSSYDLLSILASIIALFFASFYSSIQTYLARNKQARWLIYGIAGLLLVAFLLSLGINLGANR